MPSNIDDWYEAQAREAKMIDALRRYVRSEHVPRANKYWAAYTANSCGWTLRTIAEWAGVSYQAVSNWLERHRRAGYPAPDPPPGFVIVGPVGPLPPPPPPPPRPPIPPQTVAQMRQLQQVASRTRGKTRPDAPTYEASMRFNEILIGLMEDGYPIREVAEASGMTVAGLRFRLGRAGYLPPPPSQAHALYKDKGPGSAPRIPFGSARRRS
jgi:hypothetical protein